MTGAVRLDRCTWPEVAAYLGRSPGILLPVGSTEQHGPMGLIGTDALCAQAVAEVAAREVGALVAPTLAYTPAPFNTGFPGTVSVSEATFRALVDEVLAGLADQGFARVYAVNGHGANLAPLQAAAAARPAGSVRVRSWWAFETVGALRDAYYGPWEGMHATPSEVAITQALGRVVPPGAAADPPRALTAEEIAARSGDRHGSPERHKAEFPDGRVGSHSALARPSHGHALLATAAAAVAADYTAFIQG